MECTIKTYRLLNDIIISRHEPSIKCKSMGAVCDKSLNGKIVMQRTRAVICKGISRRENDLLTKAGFDAGYKIQLVLSFHYVPGIVIVTSHTLFLLIRIIIVSDTNFYTILNMRTGSQSHSVVGPCGSDCLSLPNEGVVKRKRRRCSL